MSNADALPQELDETLHLLTALATHLLASEIEEPAIAPERVKVMISAARFLQENDVPWPPVVREALNRIAQRMEARHGE